MGTGKIKKVCMTEHKIAWLLIDKLYLMPEYQKEDLLYNWREMDFYEDNKFTYVYAMNEVENKMELIYTL